MTDYSFYVAIAFFFALIVMGELAYDSMRRLRTQRRKLAALQQDEAHEA